MTPFNTQRPCLYMPTVEARSTRRAQTSLAEADHDSLIAQCKGKRLTPKVLNHYRHHDLDMLPLLWSVFAHLLILEYPDHHQNLISSSLYYPRPLHKITS